MPRPQHLPLSTAPGLGEGRACQSIIRCALEHFEGAWDPEAAQPECDRVDAGRVRQLIGEAFHGEAVGDLAGRAQIRNSAGSVLDGMRCTRRLGTA